MSSIISLKDYEGLNGFGPGTMGTESDVDNLNKALAAGTAMLPTVGGDVLRVESLEGTMRATTFTLGNIKLFKKAPRLPAYSTVEEYNLLEGYGQDGIGGFTLEGELPQLVDSQYRRKAAFIKFLGLQGEVTLPMTLVRSAHGNAVALEVQNKAVKMMELLERAMFTGNSAHIPQEFDGLFTQILSDPQAAANNVIDCRSVSGGGSVPGAILEDYLELAATMVVENFGVPNELFLTPRAMSDITRQFYPRERLNLPYPTEGKVGLAIKAYESSAGTIGMNSDVFMRPGRNPQGGANTPPLAATSSKAPSAPTSVSPVASAGVTGSRFYAGDAGAYHYAVTAINRYGESAACATTAITISGLVAAGGAVTLTITPASSTEAATAFRVYRTAKGAASTTAPVLLTTVPNNGSGYVDLNVYLPGASNAIIFQNDLHFWSWRQLAPMMRVPLATIAPSIRWMQLIYGTPIVYTPRKAVVFLNVRDQGIM